MQHCTARLLTWARVIGLLLAMSSVLCRAQTASWGAWSSWSECSKDCSDEGVRSRTRKCSSSTQPCSGSGSGYKACDNINCGEWSQWSSWSSCVATCDRIEKTRLRSCEPKHPNAVRILLYCGDAAERFESKTCPGTTVQPIASPQPQILSTVVYFYPMGSPAEEFSTALLTCCVQSRSIFNLQFVSAKTGRAIGNSSTTHVTSSVNQVTVVFAPVQLADHGKYSCKDVVPLGSSSKVIEETKHLQVTPFIEPTTMMSTVTTEMPTPSSTPSSTPTTRTPSQTTPTRLSPTSTMTAETVFTDRAEVSMTTFSMTTFSMTTEENAVIATDSASGSDGGSNAKTLIAVIAPIGSIVFIAVLAGLLFVIWKRRKSSVITVTRPIPADKRRKFQKVSEPDSPI